jgi:hypothetical protein
MLGVKHNVAALICALLLGTPAGAQQYGAPQPQQDQSAPASLTITGTWSNMSQGQAGQTETTYGFGQDGTFAQVQQSQNGEESRFCGTYTVNQVSANSMQLSLQINGFLAQIVCVQIPGFPPRCNQQSGPSTMSGVIAFNSDSSVEIGGETFTRDSNPTLLNLQIPQQLTLNGTAPTPPVMAQPVDPNNPGGGAMGSNDSGDGGSQCDDLQQERLCAINNGHYVQSAGCMMCVPP